MAGESRGERRDQVSVTVDGRTLLVLRLLAARDRVSIPDVVRKQLDRLVKQALKDPDFLESVLRLEASQARTARPRRRPRVGADVADLGEHRDGRRSRQRRGPREDKSEA
jgi:hypothetical protein